MGAKSRYSDIESREQKGNCFFFYTTHKQKKRIGEDQATCQRWRQGAWGTKKTKEVHWASQHKGEAICQHWRQGQFGHFDSLFHY